MKRHSRPDKVASQHHLRAVLKVQCIPSYAATMTLPTLPEEILVLILEDFALPNNDREHVYLEATLPPIGRERLCLTTLANSCLASRSLHRLAWPILYRHFSNDTLSWRWQVFEKLDPTLFLQTICTKPEYGSALRSLTIGPWAPVEAMDATELFESLQGDATLTALFQWRARSFWLGEDGTSSTSSGAPRSDDSLPSALSRSLEMGLADAHMAMLLLLCPRIKELDITVPPHFTTSMIARVLDTTLSRDYQKKTLPELLYDPEQEEADYAVAQMFEISSQATLNWQKPSMLQDLVRCSLTGAETLPFGFKFFKKLICLPSLQELSISGLQGGYDNATDDLEVGVASTNVRRLSLQDCHLSTVETSSIIRCCPNLLGLTIVWVDYLADTPAEQDCRLRFGDIGDAIVSYTSNLRSLRLLAPRRRHYNSSSGYPYTLGKSLQPLNHLASLTLEHDTVYGTQPSEVLSLNPHTTHGHQSSIPQCTIRNVVPKSIRSVKIENTNELMPIPGEEDVETAGSWKDWEIKDFDQFLQDPAFARMCSVYIDGRCAKHFDEESARKHGWEVSRYGRESFCTLKTESARLEQATRSTQHGTDGPCPTIAYDDAF